MHAFLSMTSRRQWTSVTVTTSYLWALRSFSERGDRRWAAQCRPSPRPSTLRMEWTAYTATASMQKASAGQQAKWQLNKSCRVSNMWTMPWSSHRCCAVGASGTASKSFGQKTLPPKNEGTEPSIHFLHINIDAHDADDTVPIRISPFQHNMEFILGARISGNSQNTSVPGPADPRLHRAPQHLMVQTL